MQSWNKTQIEIPAEKAFIGPAAQFILKFASDLGISEDRKRGLLLAVEQGILILQKNVEAQDKSKRIGISVYQDGHTLFVDLINRSVPLYLREEDPDHAKFNAFARALDKVEFHNLGRSGQTVSLSLKLELPKDLPLAADLNTPCEKITDSLESFEVREIRAGEERSLSQLFYHVYEYQYIHDFVYYPERIRQLLDEKKLISLVAVKGGQLVGHVGLLKWGDTPAVYEPCLGVVDPRLKSRGLFGKIFQQMMDFSKTQSMQYMFFDFVTNHDYSQRFVAKYGTCDLALFVGCQSKETQARLEKLGIGMDSKEMERYSLLFGVIPRVPHPFGKEILLPNNLGEMLGFLLEPLNLSWSPAPRFQLLKGGGSFKTSMQPVQNAVVFDLYEPGRAAVNQILLDWRQFLRSGYQYCAIDVPLEAPGLGNLYDVLSEHGFFVSGFLPYRHSDKLGFRFQSIGPTKVAFDDIKVYTENAKKLLAIVRRNYERNELL